jgi:hypothetical protein
MEILATLTASLILARLYIKNSAYSRDSILVIAGFSTILLSCIAVHFSNNSIMGQTLLTQVCMSLFLLGNVKSKKTKWASNFAKSIILCIFATTIAVNNVIYYQTCLMAITLINFLFNFINFNKPLTRIFDIIENIMAIIVMTCCYNDTIKPTDNSRIILLCSILVFNGLIACHIYKRTINLSKLFNSMKPPKSSKLNK